MVIADVVLRFLTSGPAQVGVGHQHTPIGKWTFRGAAHTIAKLMLLQTGINMIVPVSIMIFIQIQDICTKKEEVAWHRLPLLVFCAALMRNVTVGPKRLD